jgi:hypothetical protein
MNICAQLWNVGWDSVVGIVTCYGMGDPGTKSCRGNIFTRPDQTRPRVHPASQYRSIAIPVLPLCAFMAGYRVKFTFKQLPNLHHGSQTWTSVAAQPD